MVNFQVSTRQTFWVSFTPGRSRRRPTPCGGCRKASGLPPLSCQPLDAKSAERKFAERSRYWCLLAGTPERLESLTPVLFAERSGSLAEAGGAVAPGPGAFLRAVGLAGGSEAAPEAAGEALQLQAAFVSAGHGGAVSFEGAVHGGVAGAGHAKVSGLGKEAGLGFKRLALRAPHACRPASPAKSMAARWRTSTPASSSPSSQ